MSAAFPIPLPHKAGHVIIAAAVAVMLLLFFIALPMGMLGALGAGFCFYFFRDPNRVVPVGDGLMVSPADGRVIAVREAQPPEELGLGATPRMRISIFLSVFNVHVNRIAAAGTIRKKIYHAGKFLHAAADKASDDNERLALVVDLAESGMDYAQVQIAGLIARRIICDIGEGQAVETGARYGIIRFGSRMDVYLPMGVAPQVAEGQTVIGGETVLAAWRGQQIARAGVTR